MPQIVEARWSVPLAQLERRAADVEYAGGLLGDLIAIGDWSLQAAAVHSVLGACASSLEVVGEWLVDLDRERSEGQTALGKVLCSARAGVEEGLWTATQGVVRLEVGQPQVRKAQAPEVTLPFASACSSFAAAVVGARVQGRVTPKVWNGVERALQAVGMALAGIGEVVEVGGGPGQAGVLRGLRAAGPPRRTPGRGTCARGRAGRGRPGGHR
jgi:hypothetical protein